MKHNNFKIKIFSISALFFLFLIFGMANAQSVSSSPEFMMSWRAGNYAPEWYSGKVLPTVGSSVRINFELIDEGKPADLSKNAIRWYVNGDLVKNENDGLGVKNLMVSIPSNSGNEMLVAVSIVDYVADSVLGKTIVIPVSKPEAVINSPYSQNKIESGLSSFELIPFFFNVDSLNELAIKWSANGIGSQPYENDSWQLDLNIESQAVSGFKINLGAVVKNQLNPIESASKSIMVEKK
jgi:hypothetical protein